MKLNNMLRCLAFAALAFDSQTSFASLISNGGFESGLTGWTCTTGGDGACGTGAFATGGPKEGASHFWGFDNTSSPGMNSQTFGTTVGALYEVGFWAGSYAASPTNNLSLDVGDLSVGFSFAGAGWLPYYSATFVATSASSMLEYSFDTDDGTGTLWLDDVSVTVVPEPAILALLGFGLIRMAGARRKRT